MKISENKLREIIANILISLEDQGYLENGELDLEIEEPKREIEAYVMCETGREAYFIDFLRANKESGDLKVTAVLDNPSDNLIDVLIGEKLCQNIIGADAYNKLPVDFSVYPSISRTSLAACALGMDNTPVSKRLRGDFEEGRKVAVFLEGMDGFTGNEPEAYKNMFINYIKVLHQMGISILRNGDEVLAAFENSIDADLAVQKSAEVIESRPEPVVSASSAVVIDTKNNLLTAKDLKDIPVGSTVILKSKKIILPLAKDMIRDRKLKIQNS